MGYQGNDIIQEIYDESPTPTIGQDFGKKSNSVTDKAQTARTLATKSNSQSNGPFAKETVGTHGGSGTTYGIAPPSQFYSPIKMEKQNRKSPASPDGQRPMRNKSSLQDTPDSNRVPKTAEQAAEDGNDYDYRVNQPNARANNRSKDLDVKAKSKLPLQIEEKHDKKVNKLSTQDERNE